MVLVCMPITLTIPHAFEKFRLISRFPLSNDIIQNGRRYFAVLLVLSSSYVKLNSGVCDVS